MEKSFKMMLEEVNGGCWDDTVRYSIPDISGRCQLEKLGYKAQLTA